MTDPFGHTKHDTEQDEAGYRWCNDCEVRFIPERNRQYTND